MPLWPWKRKSPRLEGFDYATEGAYFITVCIQKHECLLGRVSEGIFQPNAAGKMVERWWQKLESKFPRIKIDSFYVVMPNHFHGIVFLRASDGAHTGAPLQESPVGADPCVRPGAPALSGRAHRGAPLQKIVQWFKTMSTNEYIHGVKEYGWPQFKDKLWQRSFYNHVIRNEESLSRIREYIATNPNRWILDRENLQATGKDDFDVWLDTFNSGPQTSPGGGAPRRGGPRCPPVEARRRLGDAGEDLAAAALRKQGYKILERNYTTPLGEIDLIARHRGDLVFIEVKTRKSLRYGAPQDAVSPAKQARLHKLADYYVKRQRLGEVPLRFDVVGITVSVDGPQVEVIQNAF